MKNITETNIELNKKVKNQYNPSIQLFDNRITWLSSKEAADYLRISVPNLRVKVSRGEIPVSGRLNRLLRFKRRDLDQFLESSVKRRS